MAFLHEPRRRVPTQDRYRRLMDIQPDESAILHLVSPPFLRLGTGQSGATLERRMPRERPPNQSAHTAIIGSKLEHLSRGGLLVWSILCFQLYRDPMYPKLRRQ